MTIHKYTISNDPDIYEAWPDLVLTDSGKLICVFAECTHHTNRDYTRIMLCESCDRGRTWSPKHPLTEGTKDLDYMYNCPRITKLSDGRLVVTVDRTTQSEEDKDYDVNAMEVLMYFSSDDGKSWSQPVKTPQNGIVPDKLTELDNGRWLISAHYHYQGKLTQFLHYSDDQGKTWSERIMVAHDPELNLCEASLLPLGNGTVLAFMRENSFKGFPCQYTVSTDNGETWGPVLNFPLPGCHRPTSGLLQNGDLLITYRYVPGAWGGWGYTMQNLFAGLCTCSPSGTFTDPGQIKTRILPVDYDRSPVADIGYSGWVQFPDGEIYIVSYLVDDAIDKAQIRGYSLNISDFILPGT